MCAFRFAIAMIGRPAAERAAALASLATPDVSAEAGRRLAGGVPRLSRPQAFGGGVRVVAGGSEHQTAGVMTSTADRTALISAVEDRLR